MYLPECLNNCMDELGVCVPFTLLPVYASEKITFISCLLKVANFDSYFLKLPPEFVLGLPHSVTGLQPASEWESWRGSKRLISIW